MENIKLRTKIRINCMNAEPKYTGREGIVTYIDSMGLLHGTWGGLAVIPEVDDITILEHEVIDPKAEELIKSL